MTEKKIVKDEKRVTIPTKPWEGKETREKRLKGIKISTFPL